MKYTFVTILALALLCSCKQKIIHVKFTDDSTDNSTEVDKCWTMDYIYIDQVPSDSLALCKLMIDLADSLCFPYVSVCDSEMHYIKFYELTSESLNYTNPEYIRQNSKSFDIYDGYYWLGRIILIGVGKRNEAAGKSSTPKQWETYLDVANYEYTKNNHWARYDIDTLMYDVDTSWYKRNKDDELVKYFNDKVLAHKNIENNDTVQISKQPNQ